jgi:hypothetical protein
MTIFRKTTAILIIYLIYVPVQIQAQQREFYINPITNIVGVEISHRADFSQYKYAWEVRSLQNDIVIPRSEDITAPVNVWERFVVSRDELYLTDVNIDIIPIRWNGRRPDGELLPDGGDGKYFIVVYEISKNNPQEVRRYPYPVTIITKEIQFQVELDSNEINRKEKQILIVLRSEDEVQAYSWRVIIRNADGSNIEDRFVSREMDASFPGFYWNDYDKPDIELLVPYTIIVEATDRAGERYYGSNSFVIVEEDIRRPSHTIAEETPRPYPEDGGQTHHVTGKLSDIPLTTDEDYPYLDVPDFTFPGYQVSGLTMADAGQNMQRIQNIVDMLYPFLDEINIIHIHGFANPLNINDGERRRIAEEENELRPLSLRRAEYVKNLFVLMGIPEEKIQVTGMGGRTKANPLDSNENWKNRVVKIYFE